MASTFTNNTGIEKIGDGQQSGLWGQTTNANFDIIDRALNGVVPINLVSTSFTLTTAAGALSDGQAAGLIFTGSLGSAATITVSPNDAQKTYLISNQTNQSIIITQGSGGDVTIRSNTATIVMCTGGGSTSSVIEVIPPGETPNLPNTLVQRDGSGNFAAGTITANLTGNVTGNLTGNVTGNVTGNASTANAWSVARTLTVGVTGKSVNGSGNVSWSLSEIGAAPTSHTHVASDVIAGVFSTARLASGAANSSTFLRGDSTWSELPDSGVLSVTASAPLASSGGANPNLTLDISAVVPSGVIVMWSGSIANIPAGWLLCNGSNGTPDLRNRFVVGAGGNYAVNATGGENTVSLTTAQMPNHTHSFSATTGGAGSHSHTGTTSTANLTGSINFSNNGVTSFSASGIFSTFGSGNQAGFGSGGTPGGFSLNASHNHSFTTSSVGNHTHSVSGTTGGTGGGQAHENRPPYYALAYIMKA